VEPPFSCAIHDGGLIGLASARRPAQHPTPRHVEAYDKFGKF
jgi:hypothetical protein